MVTKLIFFLGNMIFGPTSVSGPDGFRVTGPAFFVESVVLTLAGVFFGSLIWVYRDARSRQKNGLLLLLFILFTGWPFSFLWWFWLRPPLLPQVRGSSE